MTAPLPHPTPEAEQAFADYLRQVEEGVEVDFERFCAEHAALSDQLHRLKRDYERMAGVVDGLGSGFDGEPAATAGQPSNATSTATVDPSDSRDGGPPSTATSAIGEVIERLSEHRTHPERYAPRGEIARGGMGVVLRMWDADLRRNLAMKVMRETSARRSEKDRLGDTRKVGRFLEEAQITGQLDHPGIVPVHEMGLDSDGRLYFTMRLVRGRSLREIFELVHERAEGWTVARALGVILRVCEAMAYAHSKRVIHRDIKPANVMVGRFGEVYVMDWGLAKVMGKADLHDIRPLTTTVESLSEVRTDRHDEGSARPDSPLVTMDGSVVGTPAYMSPEQARGQIDRVGPPSDIYAAGALLYELLSGRMPYHEQDDEKLSPYAVLNAVREGPPRPVHQIDSRVPHELVAICEKAMARDIDERYDGMLAMAEDLRAFLEGRVVAAYEGGAVAELRKWILRNKVTSLVLAVALVALSWLGLDLITKNEMLVSQKSALENALRLTEQEKNERAAAQREAEQAAERAERSAEVADRAAAHARWSSYVSSVAAADGSLRFREPAEARRRLDEAPAELRGWEWRHLSLVVDPSLAALDGHGERVTQVAFSPAGGLLASGSWDGTVRLWNAEQSSNLTVLDNDRVGISALAFHPDGRRLALADYENRVSLWDVREGRRIVELPPTGSNRTVGSLAFDPAGRRLFVASGRRVRSWRVGRDRWVTFPEVHRGTVNALAVSPDGALLVSGSEDTTLQVWDAQSGIPRLELFHHQAPVLAVAHSPVANNVATGCADGLVRLFDPVRGRLLAALGGHDGPVRTVDFSPDGATLLSAGDDGTLRLWDAYTGAARATLTGHADGVLSARFDTRGQLLASGSLDRSVRLWDVAWRAGRPALAGHGDVVTSVAVDADGRRAASAAWDGQLRLWELDGLLSLAVTDLPGPGSASVAFRPDGRRLAAGMDGPGADGRFPILIWDSSRHDALGLDPLELQGHAAGINDLAYDPSGRVLASASDDRSVRLWDADDGSLLADLNEHAGWVSCVAFHPTEPWLASGGFDEAVRLWSLKGRALGQLPGHGGPITTLAFSPDGRLLATGSHDHGVRLFDATSRELVHDLVGHQTEVVALAFHPVESRLASTSADGTLRLWDTATGMHLLTLPLGAGDAPLAFDPDGQRLLVATSHEVSILETSPPGSTFPLRYARAEVAERAERLFASLLDELRDPRAVLLQLSDDRDLDDDLRREALRQARNFGTSPDRLAETAWNLLIDKHAGAAAHAHALRLARAAEGMRPGDPRLLNVLGVAQYRTGDDLAATITLRQSRAANATQQLYPPGWDLLFIAMANARLGSRSLAQANLDEALSLSPGDPVTMALGTEARMLLEDLGP